MDFCSICTRIITRMQVHGECSRAAARFLDISASTAIHHVRPDVAAARAALRADGMTALYIIDGAMDGSGLLAYVEQVCRRRGRATSSS